LYLRDGRSLQRKYQALCRTKTPSGDPELPEHLALAFDVKRGICDRASIATGYEEMNLNGSNVDCDDDESSLTGVEEEGEEEEEEELQQQQQQQEQPQTLTKKNTKATKKTSPPTASVTSVTLAPPNVARRGTSPSPIGDFLHFAMELHLDLTVMISIENHHLPS
jgi:hypothetical protein